MPNAVKEKFVEELTQELKKSDQVVITDYQGMKADEFNELRGKLRSVGAKYTVVKNRLARLALRNVGWDKFDNDLKGPSALAYQATDTAGLAKILSEFGVEHKNLKLKGGFVFGTVANAEGIKTLASIPPREVLLATLLARLNSPLQTLLRTLNEPIRSLNAALSAVGKKKEATPAQ